MALQDGSVIALGLFEIGRQLTGRQGLAVVIALTFVAAFADDVGFLLGCLHAFGDDLHAQAFAQLDDCPHDGGIVVVIQQVLDKALVDFDFVQRQAFR